MECPECGSLNAFYDLNRYGDGRDYLVCPDCGALVTGQHFDDEGYEY